MSGGSSGDKRRQAVQEPLVTIPADGLSKSHRAIANYVLANLSRVPYATDEEIAEMTGVSTATVSRFWRAIGFGSLKAFKQHLRERSQATPAGKMRQMLERVDKSNIFADMTTIVIRHLEESARRMSAAAFDEAVRLLDEARAVYVYGAGSSSALAELVAFRLNRLGMTVRRLASGHELFEQLVHAGAEDALLLFAFVQSSPEADVLLDYRREAGYAAILITDLFVSEMIDAGPVTLRVDRGDLRGFHTMAAPVALIDSLAVALAARRGKEGMRKLERLHELRRRYAHRLPRN